MSIGSIISGGICTLLGILFSCMIIQEEIIYKKKLTCPIAIATILISMGLIILFAATLV